MTVGQVKRLVSAYRARGERGLVWDRRGKPSNNQLAVGRRSKIEAALRDRHPDFAATLAAEKLAQHEGIVVSKETLRRTQIRLGLWRP